MRRSWSLEEVGGSEGGAVCSTGERKAKVIHTHFSLGQTGNEASGGGLGSKTLVTNLVKSLFGTSPRNDNANEFKH